MGGAAGRWLHLADDECYGWEAGTLPEHRGRGLFTALLLASGRAMAAEGRRVMWGGIHDHNLASQRANAAAGFRPVLQLQLHADGDLHTSPAPYADARLVTRALALLGRQEVPTANELRAPVPTSARAAGPAPAPEESSR